MDSTCEHRSRPDDREREWVTRLRRMREERVVGFAAVVCIACEYGWRSEEEGLQGGGAAVGRRRRLMAPFFIVAGRVGIEGGRAQLRASTRQTTRYDARPRTDDAWRSWREGGLALR